MKSFLFQKDNLMNLPREEAERILNKYSDRVPVVVTLAKTNNDAPLLDKNKYLVPRDLTVGQFQYVIRKRLRLSPEKALFLFVKNCVPPTSQLIETIYEENKSDNLFLYITYSLENVFG